MIYRFGQVVFAYLDDGRGRTKDRPAVIVSSDDECRDGTSLLVIAITKQIEEPCPPHHILVHDSHRHDPATGLDHPCVAKCNWVRDIPIRKIVRRSGDMPSDLLEHILEAFDRIQADPSFDDWV